MHKTKVQILFKCPLPHEKPQYEDTQFSIQKTLDYNKIQPIYELIIEDCHLITDEYFYKSLTKLTKLIYLGLNNCGINSLKNFPKINSLKRLTLDFNNIEHYDLIYLRYYNDKLLSLSLIQNKFDFKNESTLKEIYKFTELIQLSIAGNSNNFIEKDWIKLRAHIFDKMENLVFLDGLARGEFISSVMENQFDDLKEEQEYLGRYDQVEKIIQKEYKNE